MNDLRVFFFTSIIFKKIFTLVYAYSGDCEGRKMTSDSLGLAFQDSVSSPVGAGDQTGVSFKSNTCS